jgi:hypothetical protein
MNRYVDEQMVFSYSKYIKCKFDRIQLTQIAEPDNDGLESAKPRLRSPIKMPGGATAARRPWEMLPRGMAPRRFRRALIGSGQAPHGAPGGRGS